MQEDRRLLFLTTGLAYGGAETQLARLALCLKTRGWKVQVISLTPPKAYVAELEAVGIPVFSLDIRRKLPDPRPIIQLARRIRSWRPDIIHSHMVHANIMARLVRVIAPVPILIGTAHSTNEGGRCRELLYRLTDPLCDVTTQVSQEGLKRYVRVGATPKDKICYIPNGVDTECFCPNPEVKRCLRADLGLQNTFLWIAVGRFDIPKDYPNLLQAFVCVVQENPLAMLVIAGDGPLRPAMEVLAQDLGLKDRVRFLGMRHDIPELMNAADGYVMSSAWEGMANVLLEAGATGLPIVATDVGGNREVVQDGETGFLVPLKNPEALAGAMLRLMNLSENERLQMGEASRRYIQDNYSLDLVTDMWENLYREFLAKKGIDDYVHGAEHVR